VAVSLLAVAGCQESAAQEEKPPILYTEIQKQAYSLGASIGMYMQRNLEEHDKLDLPLDKDIIARGFVDSMHGKSIIEKEEVQALMKSLEQKMNAKQQALALKNAESAIAEG